MFNFNLLTKENKRQVFVVYLHYTLSLSQICTVAEEQMKYKKLMNTLAWFFFKLLVFEYVEDSETGMAFRLPGGHQWKIFIEVMFNSLR